MSEENINELKLINEELIAEVELLQEKIELLKKDDEYFRNETSKLNEELDKIKYSKSYIILEKIRKLIGRK